MLLRMPGVHSKNYRQIMNKVQDLEELSTFKEVELASIMGNSQNAKQLWNFLHKEYDPSESATAAKTAKSETGKRWNKRKR